MCFSRENKRLTISRLPHILSIKGVIGPLFCFFDRGVRKMNKDIRWFSEARATDVPFVGGKGASLGEMYSELSGEAGVPVPNGFSLMADAFCRYLQENGLVERISALLEDFHSKSFDQKLLEKTGNKIRGLVKNGIMPKDMEREILENYRKLCPNGEPIAVRSSATAEDKAEASFAGQHDSFMNVSGDESVMEAAKKCYASLFNDRAIQYRTDKGFASFDIAMAVVFQRMVRAGVDSGASGVMFTLDPNSGHENFIAIDSVWGYGDVIVQGQANPDKFFVSKNPKHAVVRKILGNKHHKEVDAHGRRESTKIIETTEEERSSYALSDEDVLVLSGYAAKIEAHYKVPMDIEWAKDGVTGEIFIVQARPETVESRKKGLIKEIYERVFSEEAPRVLVFGDPVGSKVGKGPVHIILDPDEMHSFKKGEVLVTNMTTPDWEPIMKIASAIITNLGGKTCHAAILSREFGVPAVVGCDTATEDLLNGQFVTASCAEGDKGLVYNGDIPFKKREIDMSDMELPKQTKLMLNLGNPEKAIAYAAQYSKMLAGVGLTRLEHALLAVIGIHPQAILNYAVLPDAVRRRIDERIKGHESPREFFVSELARAIATIAAAMYPRPVIVRTTDLKTNEFRGMIGGELYEKEEANPMIGFRGAVRYLSESYAPCFAMECEAIIRARTAMGLSNIEVMIPFIRTPENARDIIELLALNSLDRKTDPALRIIGMCELPSNIFLADEFLAYFDGFSIGSNDLTQLVFGLDRDAKTKGSSGINETHKAVRIAMQIAIDTCTSNGKYIGVCGEGSSNYPELAEFFVKHGASSVSVQHDRILDTIPLIVAAEKKFGLWS